MTRDQKIKAARAEYEKVRGPALAEFEKVRGPAWAEFVKVHGPALAVRTPSDARVSASE